MGVDGLLYVMKADVFRFVDFKRTVPIQSRTFSRYLAMESQQDFPNEKQKYRDSDKA